LGLCSGCYQRQPDRPFIRVHGLIAALPDPPPWLTDFAAMADRLRRLSRAAALPVTGL
jgi:hypothetical protein